MPRRLSRFQKAIFQWMSHNGHRFEHGLQVRIGKRGGVSIQLDPHPPWLTVHGGDNNLSVWLKWQGDWWDVLLDLDVYPQHVKGGIRCRLCEGPEVVWPDMHALWADHFFEPLLTWVNDRYSKASALLLYGEPGMSTSAVLQSGPLRPEQAGFYARIDLEQLGFKKQVRPVESG
jgi:hypothetical protein